MTDGGLREGYRAFNDQWYSTLVKAVVGFGFIGLLPFVLEMSLLGFSLGDFLGVEILIVTLMFAAMAQAWNMLTGFTGYFSFGHATFFGIGAFVTQVLLINYSLNPWIGMVIAASIAALVGLFIGYLTFRYELTGHYFALATLGFALLFWALARNMTEFGGSQGLYKPFARAYADGPGLVAFQWNQLLPYFYLILAFLILITTVAWLIKNSAIGVYLFAIKEDERAAQSLGIPTFRLKMFSIAVSAFFTAFIGTYYSMFYATITPRVIFQVNRNVEILLPAVFGGAGTIVGPIMGALAVFPLSEFIKSISGEIAALDRIVYGFAIIFIVLYSPGGMYYWPERFRDLRNWLARNYGIGTVKEVDDVATEHEGQHE
jgi:branched-chain amino acid transport system permease protein